MINWLFKHSESGVTHPNIHMGNVADDVVLVVENWERGDAFVVHELEGICKRFIATESTH